MRNWFSPSIVDFISCSITNTEHFVFLDISNYIIYIGIATGNNFWKIISFISFPSHGKCDLTCNTKLKISWLWILYFNSFLYQQNHTSPVSWGCRIHRLHLCRGVRPPPYQHMSWILHYTIWWWWSILGDFWNVECSSFSSLSGPLWPRMEEPNSSNRTNCVQTNEWC